MDTRNLIFTAINFVVFILLQVLVFKNVVLFGYGFVFIYLAFLLLLPFEITAIYLLAGGFLTGFIVDIFYDSLGIHSGACVLMLFARQFWIRSITPRGGYEINSSPTIASMGLQWFTIYSIPLIFVHHAFLFFMEAGGASGMFAFTLTKVLSSVFFTYFSIVLYQYLFLVRKRRS